ncbi:hypothetical protein [Kutzneria sp. NPDC052558]|uniref:hypothetical protein n=1 Tax=Kutzneria sp. NPDC052558 TaxID=3364121 RepID=UPI0037C894EB
MSTQTLTQTPLSHVPIAPGRRPVVGHIPEFRTGSSLAATSVKANRITTLTMLAEPRDRKG